MGEQADRREPFDAQKEYDEATPIPISDERIEEIVKAVCRSPSAYHPKLAEAIVAKVNTTKDWLANNIRHAVLAVLASEGVVDPEEYDKAIKRWQNGCYAAELKVKRLEAELQLPQDVRASVDAAESRGMEAAAKIAEDWEYLPDGRGIADAIRAEIKP